jgi:hypothetical protein
MTEDRNPKNWFGNKDIWKTSQRKMKHELARSISDEVGNRRKRKN